MGNSRIAKNALMLYIRMFLTMVVGLYTSRVVLATLGVEDYGIYGVVGGVVGMMGFINASMSGATSRFITYELGRGDRQRLTDTFASALIVHIGIALLVFVLAETVGLWFLCNKLVIPEGRMTAAHWVYQCSIASAMLGITQVPYNACIIAHERMGVYAYVEILNVTLKLLIVYLLVVGHFDKLILYALLTLAVSVLIRMVYRLYSIRHFAEARFHMVWNKAILRPMLSFSGWDLYGNGCVSLRFQGQAFLINMFHGVVYNAASNVANTVYGMITGFSFNVLQAYRPQIIKLYSVGNIAQMQQMMRDATKYTIILMGILGIPCFIELPCVLRLWLKVVPDGSVYFCRALIVSMIFVLINTIVSIGIHATGRIKSISFISGSIQLLNVPVLWVAFKVGLGVEWAYIIMVVVMMSLTTANVIICKRQIPQMAMWQYLAHAAGVLLVVLAAGLPCYLLHRAMPEGFTRLCCVCAVSVLAIGAVAYALLLDRDMKAKLRSKLFRLSS